ncbi:helix-turn-helix domain-containing protein [Paenibacillus thalictri]|nr:helix-turn-helix domain-containing protein [Paenibacillus thalictri]
MSPRFPQINSVFFQVFSKFLIIILLLTSFNYFSFSFFKNNILDEIIKNNKLNLNNTVKEYEEYFIALREEMLRLYSDSKVSLINGQMMTRPQNEINYLLVSDLQDMMQKMTANRFLYMDNVFLFFKAQSMLIERDGTPSEDRMFSAFYSSAMYAPSFWRDQSSASYHFKIFPASLFAKHTGTSLTLMPVIVKNSAYTYYISALIQPDNLFENFHRSTDDSFFILNENRQPVYIHSQSTDFKLPDLNREEDFYESEGNYYFYKTSPLTGLTYISIIPTHRIYDQILGLNITLLAVLLVSIVISIIASIWFGRRLNRPIKQIMDSLQQPRSILQLKSNIREFDFISGKIQELNSLNQQIHQDLLTKSSQLENYEYIKKLKMIYTDSHDRGKIDRFFVVLFHLNYLDTDRSLTLERVAYFMKEFIHLSLNETFPNSFTIQIEKNQILTMVFGDDQRQRIEEALSRLKAVFDHDKQSCLVTAAVSSVYADSFEYHSAYEEALKLLDGRYLSDEMEIITEARPIPGSYFFTAKQEEEFFHLLQAGNCLACVDLIRKMLEHMAASGAVAGQFHKFSADILYKSLNILEAVKVETGELVRDYVPAQLAQICSIDHYLRFFERFFHRVSELVKVKKEEQDDTIAFVLEYIRKNYAEDISLEQVAAKLNLSPSYLSIYIREKTGSNYLEHIHTFRIGKAKELLENSDLNIQEIGRQIGYYNPTSFIRMFKRFTGTTPKEYRKLQTLQM